MAGWYNPYCRILVTVLDRCYWTYREFAHAGARFSRLSSQGRARGRMPATGCLFVPQIEDALQHTSYNQSHKVAYRSLLEQAESH